MANIALDFNRLLGLKVTLRALRAMQVEIGHAADGQGSEHDALGSHSAVLRSRIGVKAPQGLRYRRTN